MFYHPSEHKSLAGDPGLLPGPAQSKPTRKLAGSQAGWHYTAAQNRKM